MLSQSQEDQASVWFFYFVAAALGLSFLVALVVLAWNNVVEREVQKFAYESLSIDDTVRTNVHAANDVLENFGSLLKAVPEISDEQLEDYAADVIERFNFIAAIGVYRQETDDGKFLRGFAHRRGETALLPAAVAAGADNVTGLGFEAVLNAGAPIPTGTIEDGPAAGGYLLLKQGTRSAVRASGSAEILVLLIDPTAVFGYASAHPYLTVRLFSESEGVGGRQLLFERAPAAASGEWAIDSLEESTQVRFQRYSMRLIAGPESTGWVIAA